VPCARRAHELVWGSGWYRQFGRSVLCWWWRVRCGRCAARLMQLDESHESHADTILYRWHWNGHDAA